PSANPVGNTSVAMATGDFTGNSNLGLAVLNQGSGGPNDVESVTILPGNGDGTFQHPLTVPLPSGGAANSIAAADFNGDGRTDLAITAPSLVLPDGTVGAVLILLGNGDGTFRAVAPIPEPGTPSAIVAAAFTPNGPIDLAVADTGANTITILAGNRDG